MEVQLDHTEFNKIIDELKNDRVVGFPYGNGVWLLWHNPHPAYFKNPMLYYALKCLEKRWFVRLFGRIDTDWAPWVYKDATIIVENGIITHWIKEWQ